MSKRALLAVLVVVAGVTAAAAYASSGSAQVRAPLTIRARVTLCGQPGAECGFIDLAPKGTSLGDEFTFNVRLGRHGRRVGTLSGTCSLISLSGNGTNECDTTITLARGTVQAAGLFHFGGPGTRSTLAITGGTGFFRNARGDVLNVNGMKANRIGVHVIP